MIRHLLTLAVLLSITTAPAITIGGSKKEAAAETEADRAYAELQKGLETPATPEAWRKAAPTAEERASFYNSAAQQALESVKKAIAFTEEYPDHPKIPEVKKSVERMRLLAIRYGSEMGARTSAFEARAVALQTATGAKGASNAVDHEALARGARELQKDFPYEPRVYDLLHTAARGLKKDAAREIYSDIASSLIAEPALKGKAAGFLNRMDIVGQPMSLKFTSVQGKPVDITQMKGKVVLIDFWATWCGPCLAAMPNVKKTYAELNSKGFEIIGISFDDNRGRLVNYIQKEAMPWPQYFDGLRWNNRYGREFGITGIPSMWLVDKKGIVRDLKGGENLSAKVQALLAEE